MSQLENSGYKGSALQALKKTDCDIGDIIRVTSKGKTYEGILIPRSELGEGTVVIVKMKSGYNIGIRITTEVKIEKIGKGAKPAFASPPLPKQNPALPHVVIMSTGGTIASRVDYRTGAVRSAIAASVACKECHRRTLFPETWRGPLALLPPPTQMPPLK